MDETTWPHKLSNRRFNSPRGCRQGAGPGRDIPTHRGLFVGESMPEKRFYESLKLLLLQAEELKIDPTLIASRSPRQAVLEDGEERPNSPRQRALLNL